MPGGVRITTEVQDQNNGAEAGSFATEIDHFAFTPGDHVRRGSYQVTPASEGGGKHVTVNTQHDKGTTRYLVGPDGASTITTRRLNQQGELGPEVELMNVAGYTAAKPPG
jgi:hypothetical protein